MGVMECSRKDCPNIMCDTDTSEGYICRECQTEFEELVGSEDIPRKEMNDKFKAFMNTEKGHGNPNELINVNDFFKE